MRTLIEHLDVAFTVDADDTILRDASVVIEDDRIAEIGAAADIARRHGGRGFDRVIDGRMKAICPGFVDSHVHLSQPACQSHHPRAKRVRQASRSSDVLISATHSTQHTS